MWLGFLIDRCRLRRIGHAATNADESPPAAPIIASQVVCCRLTPLQTKIYKHLLSSKEIRHILNGKQTNILSSIGAMQKVRAPDFHRLKS